MLTLGCVDSTIHFFEEEHEMLGFNLTGNLNLTSEYVTAPDDNISQFYWINATELSLQSYSINCSKYINGSNNIRFIDSMNIIGCALTELHESNPVLAQVIMDKYNLIVDYEAFNISKNKELIP